MADETTTETTVKTANYEFNEEENKLFVSLTRNMRILSYSLFMGGALYVIYGCFLALQLAGTTSGLPVLFPVILSVFAAFVIMFLGLYLKKASADFVQIVCTEGSDISHLMHGVAQLRQLFAVAAYLAWPLVLALLVAVLTGSYYTQVAYSINTL
ncbi:MAG: hypothetical protein AMXMBFR33_20290 [Candidatus Xenobia bacterium]